MALTCTFACSTVYSKLFLNLCDAPAQPIVRVLALPLRASVSLGCLLFCAKFGAALPAGFSASTSNEQKPMKQNHSSHSLSVLQPHTIEHARAYSCLLCIVPACRGKGSKAAPMHSTKGLCLLCLHREKACTCRNTGGQPPGCAVTGSMQQLKNLPTL